MFLLNVQMKFSVIYENQRDPEYLTSWYPKYQLYDMLNYILFTFRNPCSHLYTFGIANWFKRLKYEFDSFRVLGLLAYPLISYSHITMLKLKKK